MRIGNFKYHSSIEFFYLYCTDLDENA